MSEHYTRSTESCLHWCNQCARITVHTVSGGRRGRCTEHDAPKESQRQIAARQRREREQRQPGLFR